jgi:hypothetical protein
MGTIGEPTWQMSYGHTEIHPKQQQALHLSHLFMALILFPLLNWLCLACE